MIEKLKPCPFCGGEAVVDRSPVLGYAPAVSFEVRCSVCGQKRFGGYFDTVYKSEKWARKKAIEAWNKRISFWKTELPTKEGKYLVKYAYQLQDPSKYKIDYRVESFFIDSIYVGGTGFTGDWTTNRILGWTEIEDEG